MTESLGYVLGIYGQLIWAMEKCLPKDADLIPESVEFDIAAAKTVEQLMSENSLEPFVDFAMKLRDLSIDMAHNLSAMKEDFQRLPFFNTEDAQGSKLVSPASRAYFKLLDEIEEAYYDIDKADMHSIFTRVRDDLTNALKDAHENGLTKQSVERRQRYILCAVNKNDEGENDVQS